MNIFTKISDGFKVVYPALATAVGVLGGPPAAAVLTTLSTILGKSVTNETIDSDVSGVTDQNIILQIKQLEAATQKDLEDNNVQLVNIAGQNIRAETQSTDKYTSRMRPTCGYVIMLILFLDYGIIPCFGKLPVPLPDEIIWLFGSIILGYIGARSWEKRMAPAKVQN